MDKDIQNIQSLKVEFDGLKKYEDRVKFIEKNFPSNFSNDSPYGNINKQQARRLFPNDSFNFEIEGIVFDITPQTEEERAFFEYYEPKLIEKGNNSTLEGYKNEYLRCNIQKLKSNFLNSIKGEKNYNQKLQGFIDKLEYNVREKTAIIYNANYYDSSDIISSFLKGYKLYLNGEKINTKTLEGNFESILEGYTIAEYISFLKKYLRTPERENNSEESFEDTFSDKEDWKEIFKILRSKLYFNDKDEWNGLSGNLTEVPSLISILQEKGYMKSKKITSNVKAFEKTYNFTIADRNRRNTNNKDIAIFEELIPNRNNLHK